MMIWLDIFLEKMFIDMIIGCEIHLVICQIIYVFHSITAKLNATVDLSVHFHVEESWELK